MPADENRTGRARKRQSSKDGCDHEENVLGSKEVRDGFSLAVICPKCIQRLMGEGRQTQEPQAEQAQRGYLISARPWVPSLALKKEKKKLTALLKWMGSISRKVT